MPTIRIDGRVDHHHYFHYGPGIVKLLHEQHREVMAALNRSTRRDVIMIQEIQDAIDGIAANKSAAESIVLALDLVEDQVAAQVTKIAELEATIAAGGSVPAEDLAKLRESNVTLQETITKLKTATPAGTEVGTATDEGGNGNGSFA